MYCVEDIKLDCVPVFLIKGCRSTIRARNFVRPKLEHSRFNFLIGSRIVKHKKLLTREFWDR